MQRTVRRNQGLDNAYIIQDAWSGGIAYDSFDVFRRNPVDHSLNSETAGWSINQVHLMPILDGNTSGGRQPLRVIKGSTFCHCGAALFSGEPRMKRGVEEENAH